MFINTEEIKLNSWSVFYAFIYQILIIVIRDENSKCDEIK